MEQEQQGRETTEVWTTDMFRFQTLYGLTIGCKKCGDQQFQQHANPREAEARLLRCGGKAECPNVCFLAHPE